MRSSCFLSLLFAGAMAAQGPRETKPAPNRPPAAQQTSGFNLDFSLSFNNQPALWGFYPGASGDFSEYVDGSVTYSGSPTLRLSASAASIGESGNAAMSVPVSLLAGPEVHFSSMVQGSPGAFIYVDFTDASGNYLNAAVQYAPNGGSAGEWNEYSIDTPIPAGAMMAYPGLALEGAGTAWFGALTLTSGGAPVTLPQTTPLADQLAWLKTNAFPFTSLDAGVDDAELAPLQTLVGNARIVGLGEGTHGSAEFFRMKSRLISYLARNMGFTVFAIEANLPEAYLMNNYVLNGVGDPKELLQGMYFWTWNTQEVLDMITWMRQFNASGQGRIEFLGFDMQFPAVAMNNVASFLMQADPGSMSALNVNYGAVAQIEQAASPSAAQFATAIADAQAVAQLLTANRATYLESQPAAAVDFAIENANIVAQAVTFRSLGEPNSYRDAQMAANVEWIAAQHPNERIVLWAHDQHINKTSGDMGGYLEQYFGKDYLALGELFHQGSYNAYNPNEFSAGVIPNAAIPSLPGCVEYFFHQSGAPQQILDTRLASADARLSSWLVRPLWMRTIGAEAAPGFYLEAPYAQMFDGIVYFDQVNPSTLLPFTVLITTTPLPQGTVGALYFQDMVSIDGLALVSWRLDAGPLPTGMALNADGALSGAPETSGTYNFTVTALYNGTAFATANMQLTIGQ